MKLYCDITRQRFVRGFRHMTEVQVFLTQNDDSELEIYLLKPTGNNTHPYMHDANSGREDVTAYASLCNPGGTPLTLTEAVQLTAIKNGFTGTLHLDTEEIGTFLSGRAERTAFLAIELTEGSENTNAIFYGELTLRAASTAAGTVRLPNVIRATWVTGYTGGGLTNLDGQVTVGKPLGTRFEVTINGGQSNWEIAAGSTPSNPENGIILTTDGRQLVRTLGY